MADKELNIHGLMANMPKIGASDIHIKVGSPVIYRIHGAPQRIKGDVLLPDVVNPAVSALLDEHQKEDLEEKGAIDLAVGISGAGRFRVNVFKQRGSLSLCARLVNSEIPSFDELFLPKAINRVPAFNEGLVLVVGATGSGKSTTLAAVIDRINKTRKAHILTIEDPIEFMYRDDKAFISQREIGLDAPDFATALRFSLRQDPDIILIGEIRDVATMDTALTAAETGHLVLGTLHATNVIQTVSRILEIFPHDRQPAMRQILGTTLRAIVAQRLIPGLKKEFPRVPAIELMIVDPVMKKYILDEEELKLGEAIKAAAKDGQQDFNMSLLKLVNEGMIAREVALEYSPNPDQLNMQLKGVVLNQDM